jgi:Cys-tRNA(Pro)/Cys-tRNA(Cys) deacylase
MAKKRRIKKILVEQILDKADIPYETIVFSGGMQRNQAELDAYGLTDHDIYKTLALEGNVTGPVIGIVPVDDHLNEKKLAAVSGNKRVDMIPTKDLKKHDRVCAWC